MNTSQNALTLPLRIASYALLAGLLVYPFSIAGSNVFLALFLLCLATQPSIFKSGLLSVWQSYPSLCIAVLALTMLSILGSIWSTHLSWSLFWITKQLTWLLIPCIIGLSFLLPKLRLYAFTFLSVGFSLHLVVCLLQAIGIITINEAGSSQFDPAGYVGHLTFGFLYGIWAGLLIIIANNISTRWKYGLYFLALSSLVFIFIGYGRSGYLIALGIAALLMWKLLLNKKKHTPLLIILAACILLGGTLIAYTDNKVKTRVITTLSGIGSFIDGNDWQHVTPRIKLWIAAIEISKDNIWAGVGTSDFGIAYQELLSQPEYAHLRMQPNAIPKASHFAHPHNEFLYALARWGVIGMLVTLFFIMAWFILGWRRDWKHDTVNAYLMTSSGIAILVNGLTEVSLSNQTSTVFAILILAFSMTDAQPDET